MDTPLAAVSQYAALAAATGPQEIVAEYREIYRRRIELMKTGLRDLGFTFGEP